MENNQPACSDEDFDLKCKCSNCSKHNLQLKKNLIYSFEMPRLMAETDDVEEKKLFLKLWTFLYDMDTETAEKEYVIFKQEKTIINSKNKPSKKSKKQGK